MNRTLLIFLLMLLPLQFSWAAVASYCQHETEVNTQHIGHHAATHDARNDSSSADTDTDAKTDSKLSDADCDVCHFSCTKPVCAHTAALPMPSITNGFTSALSTLYLSHIGESPEEPDWMLAA